MPLPNQYRPVSQRNIPKWVDGRLRIDDVTITKPLRHWNSFYVEISKVLYVIDLAHLNREIMLGFWA